MQAAARSARTHMFRPSVCCRIPCLFWTLPSTATAARLGRAMASLHARPQLSSLLVIVPPQCGNRSLLAMP